MQWILKAYRKKQIQMWNPHDLSFSWHILFLFYAFSFINSCTTKNITPNHADSHLLPIFKCCIIFVMLIQNAPHWLQCFSGCIWLMVLIKHLNLFQQKSIISYTSSSFHDNWMSNSNIGRKWLSAWLGVMFFVVRLLMNEKV